MSTAPEESTGAVVPPLDERLYSLDPEELAFFLAETHIDDEATLKRHLLDVQAKAYKVHMYPCIRRFAFTKLKISRLPAYPHVLKLGKERNGAILLDLGCCFGNDVRKAIADGFPMQQAIASDLRKEFWDLGHELFKSTPETFPVPFITGDAFDPSNLETVAPYQAPPETPIPVLNTLTSLNPLRGHVSAIHASSFFHLFGEEQQLQLGRSVAGLLSSEQGSIIFGSHVGQASKGFRKSSGPGAGNMFCHSPETWKDLWENQIFKPGEVNVDAKLKAIDREDFALLGPNIGQASILLWSVTRL